MKPEVDWLNIEIDHVKPILSFDVSNDEELKEAFNWKETKPLLKQAHLPKGTNIFFFEYRVQFFQAY